MNRERALKIVLVVVELLFTAMVYPWVLFVKQEPALAMMMSLYVTLGIFLLLSGVKTLRCTSTITLHTNRQPLFTLTKPLHLTSLMLA